MLKVKSRYVLTFVTISKNKFPLRIKFTYKKCLTEITTIKTFHIKVKITRIIICASISIEQLITTWGCRLL